MYETELPLCWSDRHLLLLCHPLFLCCYFLISIPINITSKQLATTKNIKQYCCLAFNPWGTHGHVLHLKIACKNKSISYFQAAQLLEQQTVKSGWSATKLTETHLLQQPHTAASGHSSPPQVNHHARLQPAKQHNVLLVGWWLTVNNWSLGWVHLILQTQSSTPKTPLAHW